MFSLMLTIIQMTSEYMITSTSLSVISPVNHYLLLPCHKTLPIKRIVNFTTKVIVYSNVSSYPCQMHSFSDLADDKLCLNTAKLYHPTECQNKAYSQGSCKPLVILQTAPLYPSFTQCRYVYLT